jgi:hypothetical protein
MVKERQQKGKELDVVVVDVVEIVVVDIVYYYKEVI